MTECGWDTYVYRVRYSSLLKTFVSSKLFCTRGRCTDSGVRSLVGEFVIVMWDVGRLELTLDWMVFDV